MKTHPPRIAIVISLLLVFSGLSTTTHATGISIRDVEVYSDQQRYYLHARANCDFSKEAIEALHHGVALHILIDIKTKQKRRMLWDKTVHATTIAYKIEYHPLSERYVLTNLNRLQRSDFQYLNNALERLGAIRQWPLLARNELHASADYQLHIRARLDIEALPAPLRPVAYLSKQWHLDSDWQRWDIES